MAEVKPVRVEPGESEVQQPNITPNDGNDDDDDDENAPLTSGEQTVAEEPDPAKAKFLGISLRNLFLFLLLVQNSSSALLRRYSKGVLKEDYNTGTIFIISEIIKVVVSIYQTVNDTAPSSAPNDTAVGKVIWLVRNSAVLLVPAAIYWCQNLLSFVALQRIDAATFSVCAQGKILSTAGFSVAFLGRKLNALKWRSLAHMMLGVILITHASAPKNDKDFKVDGDYMIGVGAVLLEVSLSGFAAVYFEKVLKSNTVKLTVWDRNVQMSVLSIGLYLPLWIGDSDPFRVLSVTAWGVSILMALGGLLVALSVKYANSILKTVAVSGAIVVNCVFGWLVLDGPMSVSVVVGGLSVILSVFNYNESPDEINLPTKDNRVEMRSNLSRLYVPNEDDPKPKFLCC